MEKEIKKPLVALFGRTNVGKSTLFNCLTERKQALVSDIPGTTRDSNLGSVEWNGFSFDLVDTAGILDGIFLEKKSKGQLTDIDEKTQRQAKAYLEKADVLIFIVDNKTGLLAEDKELSKIIKKIPALKNKIILVANKADSYKQRAETAEFNKLGLGEPLIISAASGAGTGDLLEAIVNSLKKQKLVKRSLKASAEKTESERPIKICILGKPNVGKSSFLNSVLGYERVIVSDIAHTTREPQNTEIEFKGRKIEIVDTAGISRQGHKAERLEKYGIEKTLSVLKKSDIAFLMIDISEGITHQDAKLVQEIFDRGNSLVIVANKWDKIEKRDPKKWQEDIYGKFPFAAWAPIEFISSLAGSSKQNQDKANGFSAAELSKKINHLLSMAIEIDECRKISLSESQLSKFLSKIVKLHRPAKGKGLKHPHIYELKQTQSEPPKFSVRIGSRDNLHFSYVRFIENRLREKYNFLATPVHLNVEKNPKRHGVREGRAES
ncbi:MAG: ribosome biogenesis GTPase Der [Candidatus Falkowbacteria bacterium]|nr:ribosome biogenesis GTPase Der [Candidatus Falkowbacteria bacterium]